MTYLSHCSTLFQLFGNQYFSVRTLTDGNQKNFPTLGYTIYFICAFILLTGDMASYSILASSEETKEMLTAKTLLTLLVQHSMHFGLLIIIFVSLIQSYVSTPLTKKFFLNSIKIASISHYELSHPIDHQRIRREVIRYFFFLILIYILSENILYFYERFFDESKSYAKTLVAFLPLIYLNTTSFKFIFHVKLVNFHLENVNELIKESFQSPSKLNEKVKLVKPMKIQTDELSVKLQNLRKIYNIIFENSEIINRTLGKTIFTLLVAMVLAITSSGYRLFLSAVGRVSVEKIGGKINYRKLNSF